MTRDDIIRMAREAGLYVGTNLSGVTLVGSSYEDGGLLVHLDLDELERFAALVAAAEREACARVCEERADSYKCETVLAYEHIMEAKHCAAAIRARGQ